MKDEKKQFQKADIEIVRFEKNDVISTSTQEAGAGWGEVSGGGASLDDE